MLTSIWFGHLLQRLLYLIRIMSNHMAIKDVPHQVQRTLDWPTINHFLEQNPVGARVEATNTDCQHRTTAYARLYRNARYTFSSAQEMGKEFGIKSSLWWLYPSMALSWSRFVFCSATHMTRGLATRAWPGHRWPKMLLNVQTFATMGAFHRNLYGFPTKKETPRQDWFLNTSWTTRKTFR